jgi:hypothetical protein
MMFGAGIWIRLALVAISLFGGLYGFHLYNEKFREEGRKEIVLAQQKAEDDANKRIADAANAEKRAKDKEATIDEAIAKRVQDHVASLPPPEPVIVEKKVNGPPLPRAPSGVPVKILADLNKIGR